MGQSFGEVKEMTETQQRLNELEAIMEWWLNYEGDNGDADLEARLEEYKEKWKISGPMAQLVSAPGS